MAFGKVTKLDPVATKRTVQKISKEYTEEELIDSGNYFKFICFDKKCDSYTVNLLCMFIFFFIYDNISCFVITF